MRIVSAILTIVFVGCNAQPRPVPKPARTRLSPVQIFDLRTKCQAIVDKDVEDLAIGAVGNALNADVKSHYNPITNHCYALVDVTKNFGYNWPETPNNYRSLALYDAQTRDLLLSAQQKGEAKFGNDFRGDNIFSTYEKVSDQINVLMTQEDE
jgi:hypothetical protein